MLMAYMFRQKLRLEDLAGFEAPAKKVLVFEPEEYLGALYSHYLRMHAFEVMHCLERENLQSSLLAFAPHLLVFNADAESDFAARRARLLECKNSKPDLLIVTTALNASSKDVSDLMSAGVLSHINRNFSRPQDLGLVVRALLSNN